MKTNQVVFGIVGGVLVLAGCAEDNPPPDVTSEPVPQVSEWAGRPPLTHGLTHGGLSAVSDWDSEEATPGAALPDSIVRMEADGVGGFSLSYREPLANGLGFGGAGITVSARGFGPDKIRPDYSYLRVGSNDSRRSMVFLNLFHERFPAALIVFDRLVFREAAGLKTSWQLDTKQEPAIIGNMQIVMGSEGKLVNTTLLPKKSNADYGVHGGAERWRLEVAPKTLQAIDYSLNVMQVMESEDWGSPPLVHKQETADFYGVSVADRLVYFPKEDGPLEKPVEIAVPSTAAAEWKTLVTGLAPGMWRVSGGGQWHNLMVEPEAGTLYAPLKKGTYQLERVTAPND